MYLSKGEKMKNSFMKISRGCLFCLLITIAGCCIQVGCGIPLGKYERKVTLSAPMPPGVTFVAETHNGSITIKGEKVNDCNLTAVIVAKADSDTEAQKLAEETRITLDPSANKLTVNIAKPLLVLNQSVDVSLDAVVPIHTSLELATHNGTVEISDITGKVVAATHNGKVTADRISGTAELQTHNGSITCTEISADCDLKTHNGSVTVVYSPNAAPAYNVSIVTHNGEIEFTAPPNFSAEADISTHRGSIDTSLPITVTGKIDGAIKGKIGAGQGRLLLKTHNGSIELK
jgi:DUF4097 and DUF4098 domain-containing protein YvlB